MALVKKSWIKALLDRFKDIYSSDEYQTIEKDEKAWETVLDGVSGDEIKDILDLLKQDKSEIVSPDLFKSTLQHLRLSTNKKKDNHKYVVPLQWPIKNQDELLQMTELQAMELSVEQRYDRIRLLLEQEGRDNVARLKNASEGIKPATDFKRKHWQ